LHIKEYDKTIELLTEGEEILLFRGGNGGLGNEHFKSSINRSPEEFTTGEIGEFGLVEVELQMIAEIGLIGYPNAGKSSLLNSLTNSKSKVASYAFTTLEPHLGDWHGHIIADIPGLIEGASEGKGLGHKFLRHIQRTNILVHLIDATSEDVVKDYKTIMGELVKFNSELVDKQEIVVLSKVDNVSDEKDLKEKQQALEEFTGKDVFLLSLYQDETVKGLEKILRESLK
jgi:GTP-binding protein